MKPNVCIIFCSFLFLLLVGCKQQTCDCEALKYPGFTNEVQGAVAEPLTGEAAGLPLNALPGVQTINYEEWLNMKDVPETGLFLVNTDFVPQELPEELRNAGYTLQENGTLDSSGVKITLFVQSQVFKLRDTTQTQNNEFEGIPKDTITARAFPQPWAYYSYSFWWKYDGGFCRSYRGESKAYAYGPEVDGFRPYTNIQWIQTHVRAAGKSDTDVCANCHTLTSYAKDNIGCFWPAHGTGGGNHYIYMFDSGVSIFVDWGW